VAAAAGAGQVIHHRCMELGRTQLISTRESWCFAHRPKHGVTERALRRTATTRGHVARVMGDG
jgi:hypothetical protein